MKQNVNIWEDIGVSEVIGFILILALMTMGIGLVGLYGYPQLLQEQSNANFKNMERNIIVIQNDMKSLVYKSVPYQETSMQISGGSLSVINPNPPPPTGLLGQSYFTIHGSVTGDIPFDGVGGTVLEFYPGLLQFESDSNNGIIGLQNGAVVTNGFSETGGSTMLSEPRWYLDDVAATRTLVITMIQITSADALSKNGIGTVQMGVSELYDLQDIDLTANPETIDIKYFDVEDGYNTAWQNYFKDTQVFTTDAPNPCTVSGSTLTIPGVTRLVIKTYKVEILSL